MVVTVPVQNPYPEQASHDKLGLAAQAVHDVEVELNPTHAELHEALVETQVTQLLVPSVAVYK